MSALIDPSSLDLWTRARPRLPWLTEWLTEEVWTQTRFQESGGSPFEYLKSGERLVNAQESLFTAAADSYLAELVATPSLPRTLSDFFQEHSDGAAVILDGCSLREIPAIVELARQSRRSVLERSCGRSAIPSTTEHFVRDRMGFGLPTMAPSQLASRKEWKERGIRFHYFQDPSESQSIGDHAGPIILWHRFPDLRFMDSTASRAEFYDSIWDTLELVWQRTVQALPPSRTVLVTSDHGYVFLGAGLIDQNLDGADRPLKGKRYREFPQDEPLPPESLGLFVDHRRRLAVIRGRCHNRPQAPSPSKSLYRHEGLSLMEVLTPWLVLGPVE